MSGIQTLSDHISSSNMDAPLVPSDREVCMQIVLKFTKSNILYLDKAARSE